MRLGSFPSVQQYQLGRCRAPMSKGAASMNTATDVHVPAVLGMRVEKAQHILDRVGFDLSIDEVDFPTWGTAGIVVAQTPPAGFRMDRGEMVELLVSNKAH
jgi:beta-lactam-binding protein with PASTA domain